MSTHVRPHGADAHHTGSDARHGAIVGVASEAGSCVPLRLFKKEP